MFFIDRFDFPVRDYTYKEAADFATCGEKVEIDPSAVIALDFMKEATQEQTQAAKTAESPPTLAQSTQQHSAKPTLSPRETSETALDATPAVTMPDSTENSEKRHESKHSVSNFANARLF